MLDDITPEQFDEWVAWRQITPDKLERLIKVVKLGFATLCRCGFSGGKIDSEMLDPDNPNKERQQPQEMSGPQLVANMKASYSPV